MGSTTDSRRNRQDPSIRGTPAHLAAVCREAAYLEATGRRQEAKVVLFVDVPGFRVPEDGVWYVGVAGTVNGRYVQAGEEIDLKAGSGITYYPIVDEAGRNCQFRPDGTLVQPGPMTQGDVASYGRVAPQSLNLIH